MVLQGDGTQASCEIGKRYGCVIGKMHMGSSGDGTFGTVCILFVSTILIEPTNPASRSLLRLRRDRVLFEGRFWYCWGIVLMIHDNQPINYPFGTIG
jgi:hypothetical protein